MNKTFFLIVAAIAVFMVACNKRATECPHEIVIQCANETDIATVKATITYKQHPDDECWAKYEVTSVKYENGEFELNEWNFEIVQNDYLLPIHEKFINIVSDIQAKTVPILLQAYNSDGNMVGFLIQKCGKWSVDYFYADRSFTQKGSVKSGSFTDEYDCSYEEGLNIIYSSADIGKREYTTQKPSNENCNWHFQSLCPD